MPFWDDEWSWSSWYETHFYSRPSRRAPAWERDRRLLDGGRNDDTTEQPKPSPPPTPPRVESVDALHVTGIELHIEENARKHHTEQYECTELRTTEAGDVEAPELVTRRGESFKITFTFDSKYNRDDYDTKLIFENGKSAKMRASTHGIMTIDESGKSKFEANKWGANLISKSGNDITVDVHIAANCAIGEWTLTVQTRTTVAGEKAKKFRYKHTDAFYILFNPWCKDDGTYMEDAFLLKEYVLNDDGCLFKGNSYTPKAKEWHFGQFEDGILDAALFIIRKCFKDKTLYQMDDPIRVSRVIAQVVNCCDSDNGVLWGNWSGDYSAGTSPMEWGGSVRILRQYMSTGRPVKFGQCWVFSGLTTTVCRAVGIPARSVTNYNSAHDTDKSITIDKYYTVGENGLVTADDSSDSIWNYHLWNEVWLRRPDIPGPSGKFDGWQVIDATPQEKSDGIFTCGPSPLYAIKHGLVRKGFDTAFIFAEVNADRIHWKQTPTGLERFKIEMGIVGHSISTKIPNGLPYDGSAWFAENRYREEITNQYKFEDESKESREAVLRAVMGASRKTEAYRQMVEKEDIEFKLLHGHDIPLGTHVSMRLRARNTNDYRRKITAVSFVYSVQKYTGEMTKCLKVDKIEANLPFKLMPNDVHEFKSVLTNDEYIGKLGDDALLSIQVSAVVKKTRSRPMQNCVKHHSIDLEQPRLLVMLPETAAMGEEVEAELSFENPMKLELTNCKVGYESTGFPNVSGLQQPSIRPLAEWEGRFKMRAKKKGKFAVTFVFSSKELNLSRTESITVS